jgi:hypothetical protein
MNPRMLEVKLKTYLFESRSASEREVAV